MRRTIGVGALLLAMLTGCGSSDAALEGEHDPTQVPDEVSQLIDDWWAALEQGDDSVVDLYLPSGYHLYGVSRIDRDRIVDHLTSESWTNEWTTRPFVMADDENGDYLVVRGIRNTLAGAGISVASALAFEIETLGDGSLKIAHTAYISRRDN